MFKSLNSKRALTGALALGLAVSLQAPKAQAGDCMDAWKSAFVESNMSGNEVVSNLAISAGASTGGAISSKATAAIGSAAKVALGLAAVGGVLLVANEQWDIIDRLFKEAQVGAGAGLSTLGEALQKEGNQMTPSELAERVREIDPANSRVAKALCTDDDRPVILGRYIEMVIDIK